VKPRLFLRRLKFFYQRMSRGFDDSVTWNLDGELAKLILPRLRRFKELHMGYPGEEQGMGQEEWEDALEKMIHAFEHYASEQKYSKVFPEDHYVTVDEGMKLFAEYYGHLWW
jgi:hypothetical protein